MDLGFSDEFRWIFAAAKNSDEEESFGGGLDNEKLLVVRRTVWYTRIAQIN